jgi:hypothetical protein
MQQEWGNMQKLVGDASNFHNQVQGLYNDGQLKDDGKGGFMAVTDPNEQMHIREQNSSARVSEMNLQTPVKNA